LGFAHAREFQAGLAVRPTRDLFWDAWSSCTSHSRKAARDEVALLAGGKNRVFIDVVPPPGMLRNQQHVGIGMKRPRLETDGKTILFFAG
jgi:hypothetical protein